MDSGLFTYTFLEEYEREIRPAIRRIDVFLKTASFPVSPANAACALDINEDEAAAAMADVGCKEVDADAFVAMMRRAGSRICKLYQRELQTGSPSVYTAEQIAYIYDLEVGLVKNACQKMQIREITPFVLPLVFALIPSTCPETNDYN